MSCDHSDYDDYFDRCEDCGAEGEEFFTACTMCESLNIPIIDGMAPELCDDCKAEAA